MFLQVPRPVILPSSLRTSPRLVPEGWLRDPAWSPENVQSISVY